ncbi:MAG: hypothetical protein IJB70_10990 [Clostridia bacterium]|nr:hypothetical protein [Clostridia bacterium]
MKNFKTLISIFLTAVMLITAVPVAFAGVTVEVQTENFDFSLYNEGFSENLPSNISTGYADSYRTKTEISSETRDGDDYAMKVTATPHTGTSGSNYGDVRIAYNPYPAVKNQKYTISYDICFAEYDVPTSDRGILKISAVTQGNSWNINRGLFTLSASNPDRIYAQGTGVYITKGNWYSITHTFDVASGVETMAITDSEGTTQSVTSTAHNVTEIRRLNFAFQYPCEVMFDNFNISSGSMLISDLESNVSTTDDFTFKAVVPEGFDIAKITADGKEIGTFTSEDGKNCYLVTVPAGTLPIGSHNLKVTAFYGDSSSSVEATVNIAQVADRGIARTDGTETSTEVVTFDDLLYSSGASMNDEIGFTEIKWNAAEASTPWQTNANAFMVPGPSGNEDDYGIQLRTAGNLIQIFKLDTENTPSNGKLIFDFDVLCSADGTNVKMSKQMGRPDSTTSFISSNKIFGQIEIEAGKWTHVNMVFDFSTSKWKVIANGEEVIYDASTQNKDFSEIRFTLYSSNTPFAIDNMTAYNTRFYSGVTKTTYSLGGVEQEVNGPVPADAEFVKLYVAEGLNPDTIDNITVTDKTGKMAELEELYYSEDDKSVTIVPDYAFPDARSIIVSFGKGCEFADGTPVSQPYTVNFDVESSIVKTTSNLMLNGKVLSDASGLCEGDVVSAQITAENIAPDTTDVTYVLTLRKVVTNDDDFVTQLVSLRAKDVSVGMGESDIFTLELPAVTEDGSYEVNLMIIDSFNGSKSKAEYIKIN